MADLNKPKVASKSRATKPLPCTRCSKPSKTEWRDSNGLCIRCNFNKIMGGEVV